MISLRKLSIAPAGLTLVLSLLATRAAADAWELVHEAGDLRVERRDYQGSRLDEIRGTVRVRASLNALMALLKDDEFNEEWVYRSGGARILEDEGYPRAYVYGIVDAPFPMTDRDTVVRFDYRQDAATKDIVITITNFPAFVPEEQGLVRVPRFGGFWRLRPLGAGRVEVTYQVYGDPGGWIPVWLANRAALVSVQHTLTNLTEVVKRYEGVTSPYVDEPASHR
jgi:hypothetical protein